jgi:hypothetical protein
MSGLEDNVQWGTVRLTATSLQLLQAKEPFDAQVFSWLQFAHLTGTVGVEVIAVKPKVGLARTKTKIQAEPC